MEEGTERTKDPERGFTSRKQVSLLYPKYNRKVAHVNSVTDNLDYTFSSSHKMKHRIEEEKWTQKPIPNREVIHS